MANQISIVRDDLIKALQLIVNLAERKQLAPILALVLVQINGQRITFTASDSEIEISSYIDSLTPWTKEPCSFTMPGKKILDLCRTFVEGSMVTISEDKGILHLSSQESNFNFPILAADDFPLINAEQPPFQSQVEEKEFKRLIDKTAFNVPFQDIRHYLTGLLLDFSEQYVQAVATDGHRLAAARARLTQPTKESRQLIVPRRTIMELVRMLNNEEEGLLTISCNYQYIRIASARFQLTSKLIDGHFPNWKRIIPKKGEVVISVDAEKLSRSVQRINLLINEVFRSVSLTFADDWLQLDSNNPGQEAKDRVPISFKGETLTVLLNIEYLRELLKVVTAPEIIIYLQREIGGIVIEEKGASEGNLFVIMPIKQTD